MKNKFIYLIVIFFCFSGCGITGHYGSSHIKTSEKEKVAKFKAQSFVGKNKNSVMNYYGRPRNVKYNVRHHNAHLGEPGSYTTYDEVWYYKYEAGVPLLWPDQYSIKFYFIGDIVKLVVG